MSEIPVMEHMKKDLCCGCELCRSSCPFGAIEMTANGEGFLYPALNKELCKNCGICVNKCPSLNLKKNIYKKEYYVGYAKDIDLVKHSSSGGVWSLIANGFLNEFSDSIVVGSIWSNDYKKVIYSYTNSTTELELFRRSKYSQSYKGNIYDVVKEYLDKDKYVLFTGTPCEVAAVKSFLGKSYDKLYTVDLICQGPESPLAMKQFMDRLEKKYKSSIKFVSLREVGGDCWIPQWIRVKFENGREFFKPFYNTELGESLHTMQRKSCYRCEYTLDGHVSDATIGDFHGADGCKPYYNKYGVSIVVSNSSIGEKMVKKYIEPYSVLEKETLDVLGKTNPRLIGCWNESPKREKYAEEFIKKGVFSAAWKVWGVRRTIYNKSCPIIQKIVAKFI